MPAPPIVFSDFDRGIGVSPQKGLGAIRLADIESFPGTLRAGKQATSYFAYRAANTRTFTADAGTDVCTASGDMHDTPGTNYDFTAVTFSTTDTLPAGLTAGTIYFLHRESDSTFKVSTTPVNVDGDTFVNITDAGTGTHTVTPVPIGEIRQWAKHNGGTNADGKLFALDDNGRVWAGTASNVSLVLVPGNTLTNASGRGMIIHPLDSPDKTFLFVFRDAVLDVVDVHEVADILDGPSWTNGWQNLNASAGSDASHHVIMGQDDIMYFCDARYIGSLRGTGSAGGFVPANSATYTFNGQALDLRPGETAEWMAELGTELLIAGGTFDKVYPWDRISDSFRLPLELPENGAYRLMNLGNTVYIFAGSRGNIYTTLGETVRFLRQIPDHVANNDATLTATPITWGGIAKRENAILVGVEAQTSDASGVWLLYPDGRLILDAVPSTGPAQVGGIYAQDEFYSIGFDGGAEVMNTSRHDSLEASAESELYRVGTKIKPATYSRLEAQCSNVPDDGDQIRVQYREDTKSAWTTIQTFTCDGVASSFEYDRVGLTDIENIQLRVLIDGNVELAEVRLHE